MTRALLISDTHGNINIINKLVEKTQADLVIHAGDFGFYNESSYKHISDRELLLLITHTSYRKKYQIDKMTSRNTLIEIVRKNHLLGDFQSYQDNQKKFLVPVYAVYGNHEDVCVIKELNQKNTIHNFHLLDENSVFQIKKNNEIQFQLFGIGGNFLVNNKLLQIPIAGKAGKVWATLHQFGVLYKNFEKKSEPSIFVSHVSPGKESLLTRLILHFMPNLWVSGHMGSPYTCVWNQFTIREIDESLHWLQSQISLLESLPKEQFSDEAKIAYEIIRRDVSHDTSWYKKTWNINLPDVKDGHAVLNYLDGKFFLETFCSFN